MFRQSGTIYLVSTAGALHRDKAKVAEIIQSKGDQTDDSDRARLFVLGKRRKLLPVSRGECSIESNLAIRTRTHRIVRAVLLIWLIV